MLNNVKVLSFTHFLQGPSAVQILADLGADVIKIESPKGAYERHWSGLETFLNGESVFFLLAGRNQRSLSIDLRSEEGKEVIKKLIQEVDVIVENFRPGALDRLGFSYEEVSKINPSIIYCSCSGYGSTGPYKDKPGQDLLIQAMSGIAWLNGNKNDPPTMIGTAAVDQHAAVLAALGVLAALYERRDTGKGKKVESNLLNAALDLQIEPLNYYLNGAELYDRSETGISTRIHQAPYGNFETADGYICMSLTPVDKMAEAFGDDSFLKWTRDDQFNKREEVNAKVAMHLKKQTTEYWYDIFEKHDIWYAPVNTYEDVVKDPQVNWNKAFMTFDHPKAGNVNVLAHPIRYNGEAPALRQMPPGIGEHSEEILSTLGYNNSMIEELKAKGIIR